MNDHALVLDALDRAFEALNEAAADLTVAVVLAPRRSALATDAWVLVDAVEAEAAAVMATLRRDRRAVRVGRRTYGLTVAVTTGSAALVVLFAALSEDEQEEAYQRIAELLLRRQAGDESEMARFIR